MKLTKEKSWIERKKCVYICVYATTSRYESIIWKGTPIKNHNNNNNEERKNDTKIFSRFYRFCVSDVASFIDLLV